MVFWWNPKLKLYEAQPVSGYSRDLPNTIQSKFILDKSDRENMHGLLEPGVHTTGAITNLYEDRALTQVYSEFTKLLDAFGGEEGVQAFIRANPILLHQFAPSRIFFKPPILSVFKTDIVILTTKGELLLIELEKPGTRLVKANGGVTAELQHAFDQVRDWLVESAEHRFAVLRGIGVSADNVSLIRGIVIAGRDGLDSEKAALRRVRSIDASISLYTYDDLLRSLASLSISLHQI